MNIIGKTIADVTRDPDSEALRLTFTDGSGVTFEIDGFRCIRMVPEYPKGQPSPVAQPSPAAAPPLRYVKCTAGYPGAERLQWHDGTEWRAVPVVEVDV